MHLFSHNHLKHLLSGTTLHTREHNDPWPHEVYIIMGNQTEAGKQANKMMTGCYKWSEGKTQVSWGSNRLLPL